MSVAGKSQDHSPASTTVRLWEGELEEMPAVKRVGSARLPTVHGEFQVHVYADADGKEHLVLSMGDLAGQPPLVRVHSECLTGEVFGSVRCDCRDQLLAALASIAEEGRGALVYLRQEGRGIGLANKVRAYALQDQGLDTVDANLHLGLPVDGRRYLIAAAMLRECGVNHVRLVTNNPHKIADLEAGAVTVVERVPHRLPSRRDNQAYLQTKIRRLGHLIADEAMDSMWEAVDGLGEDETNARPRAPKPR